MPKSAKDVTFESEHLKVLVIGTYGTGKSTFASTFPTPGFVFNFDNRILTYAGRDWDYEDYPWDWRGWVKFEKDLIELKKNISNYKTVVVDSTTSMSDLAMQRALMLDPKRSPTGGPIWNVHYMMVRHLVEGKLRQIVDLPCNVVVLSHISIQKDEDTGTIVDVGPLLTGQLSEIIPGLFHEVYFATTKRMQNKTQWLLQTVPIGFFKARSTLSGREARLPDFIPNDYNELMKHLKGGKENAKKE